VAQPNLKTFVVQVPPTLSGRGSVQAFGKKCPPSREDNRPIFFNSFTSPRGPTIHGAIDIAATPGSLVVSPVRGRVLKTWRLSGETRPGVGRSAKGGWYVRLQDEDGFIHYFAHLAKRPLVSSGSFVHPGQTLGFVGRTGNAITTCPHLHYSITAPRGGKVNPFPLLKPHFEADAWKLKRLSPQETFALLLLAGLTAALI
jgi:murein DD-endopeptidase MepM/ murein hydrolase activator NlpD